MTFSSITRLMLTLGLSVTAMTACSEQSKQLSEREKDIDKQAEAQQKYVERHTEGLKSAIEQKTDVDLQTIEQKKEELDLAKGALDDQAQALKKSKAETLKDLDKQADISKKVVERNAEAAKDEYRDMARNSK
ncbi:MAG: hypothetical protein J0H83_06300 [Candidatus Melainabacteria bacterium]|jgi:cell division protein FtsX|nr:hypothetical protein [Candidatus Melainabacteria bacterium]